MHKLAATSTTTQQTTQCKEKQNSIRGEERTHLYSFVRYTRKKERKNKFGLKARSRITVYKVLIIILILCEYFCTTAIR